MNFHILTGDIWKHDFLKSQQVTLFGYLSAFIGEIRWSKMLSGKQNGLAIFFNQWIDWCESTVYSSLSIDLS